MEKLEQFEKLMNSFSEDYQKFITKGNQTAGTRARKTLQEIRNLAKDTRSEISVIKKDKTSA